MTDPVKEQLSACLDGELPEGEIDLLLKHVARDPLLPAALGRYALIGETLRAKAPVVAPADFSKRVAAAVAQEPPLGNTAQPRVSPAAVRWPKQWIRPVAGFAVAAGVAAIAILALQEPQPAQPETYVADSTPVAAPDLADAASYIVPASTDASAFVPATRLTNYVVAHSEYSSPLGRRSVLSGVLAEEESTDDVADADSVESAETVTQP
jgi:sigma-E factor negative regulatory protein RseA